MQISVWPKLVAAIKELRPAVRVKWSGDSEPTRWEPWLIITAGVALETGTLGPVEFREVEWVEIDPSRVNQRGRLVPADVREALLAALRSAGISTELVGGLFRVVAEN